MTYIGQLHAPTYGLLVYVAVAHYGVYPPPLPPQEDL